MNELDQTLLVKVSHHELILGGRAPYPTTRLCVICGHRLSVWNDDPYCCACWKGRQDQCLKIDKAIETLQGRSRDLLLISRIDDPLSFVRETTITFEDLIWHPINIQVRMKIVKWIRDHTPIMADAEPEEGRGHIACLEGSLNLPRREMAY
jgi:hypothetical protein